MDISLPDSSMTPPSPTPGPEVGREPGRGAREGRVWSWEVRRLERSGGYPGVWMLTMLIRFTAGKGHVGCQGGPGAVKYIFKLGPSLGTPFSGVPPLSKNL